MKKLTKVWFVTGASKGLGLSLVKKLLLEGCKVAATSRSVESLTNAVGVNIPNFLPLQVANFGESDHFFCFRLTMILFDYQLPRWSIQNVI